MFDVNKKTYIMEKTCGHIIKLSFSQNMEIRASTLSKNNIWSEPPLFNLEYMESCWTNESLICRDVRPRFGACIDNNDSIHILCQNNGKGMSYIHLSNNMEMRSTLVNCQYSDAHQDRYPDVFIAGDKIILLYIEGYANQTQIALHTLDNNGNISPSKLMDSIVHKNLPYALAIDTLKCPYLFYKKKLGSDYVLGYIKYIASTDSWTDFYILCYCTSESDILSAAVDYPCNIYLLWQTRAGQMADMNCTVKATDSKDPWTVKITDSSSHLFHNSSILAIGKHIIIYWIKNNCISYCVSFDNGHTWESQMKYDFHDSYPLYCISYKSNSEDKYGKSCFNLLPGKITKGLRLALLNDFNVSPENMAIEEVRSFICQLIKQQSYYMELLKQQANTINTLKQFVHNIDRKMNCITGELENFKKNNLIEAENKKTRIKKTPAVGPDEKDTNPALMQGTGFANVTGEYLKNLRNK